MNNECNPLPCDCKDGPQGTQGLRGPKGEQGVNGVVGTQGTQGLQGAIGSKGEKGETGDQGLTGISTIGGVGPQGPTGPQGTQGIQGVPGVDGADGIDGVAGAAFQQYTNILHDTTCPVLDFGPGCPGCFQCEGWTLGESLNGIRHFNENVGLGFSRLSLQLTPPPAFGVKITIVGTKGAAGYFFWCISGQRIEMAAYNSFTDNICTSGPSIPPYSGVHFQSSLGQGSNVVELLHIGADRWVIIKANLNNGQLPLFI